jgi:ribonuclease E
MTRKMLIDATHEEETRVAVVDGSQLVEYDYESTVRKQLKGGIYLAKVTRVEPSLQAAFVNFGGNRHGFLPFSEIHPDYFRIPVSDREALLAEQAAALEDHDQEHEDDEDIVDEVVEDDDDSEEDEEIVEVGGADKPADEDDEDLKTTKKTKKTKKSGKKNKSKKQETSKEDENSGNIKADEDEKSDEELDAEALEKMEEMDENNNSSGKQNSERGRRGGRGKNKRGRGRASMRNKKDELVDGDDSDRPFRFNLRHKYKIQEVIKRGQIMLIQVSKEERGNKGAAVTTYLSLPGRYCVLMPNSPRGGGVSRKIGNFKDRKRMREILKDLTIPEGMSVILRTAGVSRTKAEIKRDLDYLTRLWNTIREDTLKSSAPALINEEGNLIKRSIRDLYTRDIGEVLIAGSEGYKMAKEFMKMLVPSHAKKVKEYKDERVPLFHKYKVEKQITEIGKMTVVLKSGGYLVINPTEALVSVDVNSGKATKERHIEETALKTNIEAAEEVARQLRLRDLGGLVVIDFIDMEERRNNRKVENKLREALSSDRARIQVGRISSFGLLELSRQRLNPSLTESQFEKCAHCEGSGYVKTLDFAAIGALRALEEEGIQGKVAELSLNLPNDVAVYILNNKRQMLADIEERYDFNVHIRVDENLKASEFRLDVIKMRDGKEKKQDEPQEKNDQDDSGQKPKRGRRRGRRGGRRHNRNKKQQNDQADNSDEQNTDTKGKADDKNDGSSDKSETNQDKGKTKKTTKKTTKKSSGKKTAKKSEKKETNSDGNVVQTQKPSNDSKAPAADNTPKEYEVVNEAPAKKKKGWWNRLVD